MRVRGRLDRSTVEISEMKRHCNRKSSNDNAAKHFILLSRHFDTVRYVLLLLLLLLLLCVKHLLSVVLPLTQFSQPELQQANCRSDIHPRRPPMILDTTVSRYDLLLLLPPASLVATCLIINPMWVRSWQASVTWTLHSDNRWLAGI
jgi:hypothetical protein